MDKSEILRRAGAQILAESEAFCDRAEETFQDLEAWGKEPVLEEDWLTGLVPTDTYYFSSGRLVEALPALPPLQTERKRQSLVDASANVYMDVSAVVELAHAEDPQAWQSAISDALNVQGNMQGNVQGVSFDCLIAATGLSSGELLIGLLLGVMRGDWTLRQENFYGEIYAKRT